MSKASNNKEGLEQVPAVKFPTEDLEQYHELLDESVSSLRKKVNKNLKKKVEI